MLVQPVSVRVGTIPGETVRSTNWPAVAAGVEVLEKLGAVLDGEFAQGGGETPFFARVVDVDCGALVVVATGLIGCNWLLVRPNDWSAVVRTLLPTFCI